MMTRTKSDQLFAEALRYIPGGVNSPVRAFRAVGGTPFFVNKAAGARVFDVDGNGKTEALTDGLLGLRYLFGLRGAELVRGAVGNDAARTSAAAIESYIASLMP